LRAHCNSTLYGTPAKHDYWLLREADTKKPGVQFEYEPFDKPVVAVLMRSKFNSRRIPDTVSEELVVALLNSQSHEFKALFSVIQSALKARNAANCSEEILRLRTYDKLQNLVREGQVKKIGKKYKGVITALLALRESLNELRKKDSPPSLVAAHPPVLRPTRV
jgi:hypothetical protein